uniref:Uncharacterized protein n=1 Tax=Anguilla anguilla TaxID=7936 RepID=A0A0E9V7U3_ANGAN
MDCESQRNVLERTQTNSEDKKKGKKKEKEVTTRR